ncbi:MAG: hypothetical protein V3U63_06740, partial [Gemmatimonadota bacterium]
SRTGPASFWGKRMSRWPFLLKHQSYCPVNPFDSFHTWRESTDPTISNSLDHYTLALPPQALILESGEPGTVHDPTFSNSLDYFSRPGSGA